MRSAKRLLSIALGAILAAGTVTAVTTSAAHAVLHDPSGNELDTQMLSSQITWLDFGEPGVISGVALGGNKEISVGTIYTKEIYPGYVVKAEVVGLAPFMGDPENWGGGRKAAVVARRQDGSYSHIRAAGLSTGSGYTNIGAQSDGGNIGMTMRFTATINDVPTLPTIIVADGEEATDQEFELFKTTGTPWQLLAEARAKKNIPSFRDGRVTLDKSCGWCWNKSSHIDHNGALYDTATWTAVNANVPNLGLGTDTFGPVVTSFKSNPNSPNGPTTLGSVPILMTSAKNTNDPFDVSFYVNAPGNQTVQFGIVVMEEGDAPGSYGSARHLIREAAGTKMPFLGNTRPDVLQNPAPQAGDWNLDDLSDSPDEGISQLRNDGITSYTPYYGADNTFTLPVYVTPGSLNGQVTPAFVNAWADFNNNGKFDANEKGSVAGEITAAGTYDVVFSNLPQTLKTDIHQLGIRVRVANNAKEIELPTGVAGSGEVEDFMIRLILPPRGSKETTEGPQGQPQSAKVNFEARGRLLPTAEKLAADYANNAGGLTDENTMDTSVPVQIVRPDGTLADSWTEPNEGHYTVTADGTVTFTPERTFFGTAKGVALRAQDKNGKTTGWTSGTQAQVEANEADAKARGEQVSTLYEVAENINADGKGKNLYGNAKATMDGAYIPTVIPFNIEAENKETTGPQGKPQEETLVFKRKTGETLVLEGRTEAKPYFVTATGEKIEETTIPALNTEGTQIGTYTLSPETGKVVFTPYPTFHGTPEPARVKLDDRDTVAGMKPTLTSATAIYQPRVVAASDVVATNVTSNGSLDVNQVGTPTFANQDGSDLDLTDSTRVLLDKDGQPATNNTTNAFNEAGEVVGTYTLNPNTGEVTFDPNPDFVGTAKPARVKLTTRLGKEATGEYTPTVYPAPLGTPAETSGWQGEPQKGTPTFTQGSESGDREPLTPSETNPAKLVGANGLVNSVPATSGGEEVGTYTINPATGEVTFTPNNGFHGTPDPVTVRMTDKYGQPVSATYTPTVKKLEPAGNDVTSTGEQGASQNGTPTFTDGKDGVLTAAKDRPAKFYDPVTKTVIDGNEQPAMKDGTRVGTYTLDPATGTVTFTPNKNFHGTPDGITVQVTDPHGNTATGKYTPTVTPLVPQGSEKTSTGLQGDEQTALPTYTDGHGNPLTPGPNRKVFFANPDTKEGIGDPFVPAYKGDQVVGRYTLNQETGEITFLPSPSFVGTADPVTVRIEDDNGTPAFGVYTPTVTAVTPKGKDVTSNGEQGASQTATPTFTDGKGGTLTPVADRPAKFIDPATGQVTESTELPALKDGKKVGTYTLDPATGAVTFTPNKDFHGTPDGITVQVTDKNGTAATATYTPTVTPLVPQGSVVTSTGDQGEPQEKTPTWTDGKNQPLVPSADRPARFIDPETKQPTDKTELPAMKNGEKVGTYTLESATGKITFTPNPSFTGTPDAVQVVLADDNGTSATSTYTPTVEAVIPEGKDVTSNGEQGASQTATPTFTDGKGGTLTPTTDRPARFIDPETKQPTDKTELPAMKEGKQVGTYTLDRETGTVTFKPNKDFHGTPDGITVQVTDKNGTAATATYTPTVTPLVPQGSVVTSTGDQGEPQEKTPTWTDGKNQPLVPSADRPARFIDPETKQPTDKTELPAMKNGEKVGTYTLESATGKITFTPNPSFTGTPDAVQVVLADDNGTAATSTYTPTVNPVVPEGTDVSSEGWQGEAQTGTPTFTDGKGGTLTPTADRPAKFIDPATGQVTESTELPALKDGKKVGTYTLDPATGAVTFKPNKDFTGIPDGITVQVTDKNGTVATAKYTPMVKPLVPSGTATVTEQPQTETHTVTVSFTDGHGNPMKPSAEMPVHLIDPKTGERVSSVEVENVGTYTIVPETGVITFVPVRTFVGKAPSIEVIMEDANGTPARTTYTPTVKPKPPVGEPTTSTGEQGKTQTGTPTFKTTLGLPLQPSAKTPVKLIDPISGESVTTVTINEVGTYQVNPETGVITFTPVPSFLGEAPAVTVEITDEHGLKARTTYTPTVVKVTPPPVPATTPKNPAPTLPNTGTTALSTLSTALLLMLAGSGIIVWKRKLIRVSTKA